jgi:hypothetical protein
VTCEHFANAPTRGKSSGGIVLAASKVRVDREKMKYSK